MTCKNLLFLVAVFAAAPAARAADTKIPTPPLPASSTAPAEPAKPIKAASPPESVQANAEAAPLEEVVHGFFLQMRVGGGYMVKSGSIPADPYFPQLQGASESLGAGPAVDFALGYEVADAVALQLVGGMTFAGGRRTDRVRGLSVGYGGIGVRISIPLRERLNLVLSPNIAYASSSTAVEKASTGVAVMVSGGIEYFVHVRHISLGADLSIQAPLNPVRVFVGIEPYIRYTF